MELEDDAPASFDDMNDIASSLMDEVQFAAWCDNPDDGIETGNTNAQVKEKLEEWVKHLTSSS